MTIEKKRYQLEEDPSLLLVDDDEPFVRRLSRAMEKRGFEVRSALTVLEGKELVKISLQAMQ